jgi:L-amino acid N-acyltransferase YncA
MSFRPEPIPWEEHERWYERVLGDPQVLLMVGEAWEAGAWVPVGQVRMDGDGTVSLGLESRFRGRRLAGPLLRTGVLVARARKPGRKLFAHIKHENAASRHVFEQVGFRFDGRAEVLGQACGRYRYG